MRCASATLGTNSSALRAVAFAVGGQHVPGGGGPLGPLAHGVRAEEGAESAMIDEMREWSKADEEAFARSVLRRRWLNSLCRMGVITVGQVRAMSEGRLREMPNLGPKTVADIAAALADPTLRLRRSARSARIAGASFSSR